MPDVAAAVRQAGTASAPGFLLACFAGFYEEVASIKLSFEQRRTPRWLATTDGKPLPGAEMAARVSAHLEAFLRQQAADVRTHGSVAETKMHAIAQYAMAAVADEIFILELDWPGREAWLGVLLEERLFRSRNAGTRFFELSSQLLHTHSRSALNADAAAVFLLALQLGFKGQYRGPEGEAALRACRRELYRFSQANVRDDTERPAFEQAYQHRVSGPRDERLAPLSRWKVAGLVALAAYLAGSTVVWLAVWHPFVETFG